MRTYIILALIFLSCILTSCSEVFFLHVFHGNESKWTEINKETIPPAVMDAFAAEYPGINADKWYKFRNDRYAVSFIKNAKKTIALFSASGILQDEDLNMQDYYYDDYDGYWDYDNYD